MCDKLKIINTFFNVIICYKKLETVKTAFSRSIKQNSKNFYLIQLSLLRLLPYTSLALPALVQFIKRDLRQTLKLRQCRN